MEGGADLYAAVLVDRLIVWTGVVKSMIFVIDKMDFFILSVISDYWTAFVP